MRESYDFNVSIRTLKKELPETSQIGIGDDVCLFNIKYNGIDDKFSKPIRLVGNGMVFCVKGSVHMSVNLNEYDVKEGCLVVLTDQNIRGYFEDYLKLIGKLANSELPMYKDAVRSLISSMVSIAAGQWIADINRLRDEKVVKLNSRSEHKTLTFRQFIKLVSENYTQQRQVIFYADQLCMSPKYLSKLVKDVSGKSALEWIDSYVLLEAKHLLKYSDMPIKEIVFRLNFSNQTVFYKYFKAHTGMTPTDYRNS